MIKTIDVTKAMSMIRVVFRAAEMTCHLVVTVVIVKAGKDF